MSAWLTERRRQLVKAWCYGLITTSEAGATLRLYREREDRQAYRRP